VIAVVGESCTDVYVYGNCERMCPEGPVPVFNEIRRTEAMGMAANTYNNMIVFFDDVDLISNNPKDITKTRFVDSKTNQLLLRIDDNDQCEQVSKSVSGYDIIVVSDYCKGFLTNTDIVQIGKSRNKLSVLDTKRKLTQEIIDSYDFIKISEQDYLANKKIVDKNTDSIIITLGEGGACFLGNIHKPPITIQTFDVSGAGDVFKASFSYMMSTGKSAIESINFAQNCCSQVIQKRGTCVYEKDMRPPTSKIQTLPEAAEQATRHRQQGQRIVFTNGCFDLLHAGHVSYLAEARALGDILIVGINSDDSVRRLKGPQRPINQEADRSAVLAALEFIDYVVPFSEETPHNLLHEIRPDVLVKGGTYCIDDVVGKEVVEAYGGQVCVTGALAGKSTTNILKVASDIIEKIND